MKKIIRENHKQKEQDPKAREKTLAGKGWLLSSLQQQENAGQILEGHKEIDACEHPGTQGPTPGT